MKARPTSGPRQRSSRRTLGWFAVATLLGTAMTTLAGCATDVPDPAGAATPATSVAVSQDAAPTVRPTPTPVASEVDPDIAECRPAPASLGTDTFVMTTEWGPSFCALPAGFPVCPRCEPDETIGDDITAIWLAGWDATTAARWYRSALEAAGYPTVSMTSSSDGGIPIIIIESGGPRPDCKVQTTIALGDEAAGRAGHPFSYVAVRYGTGCPPP